MWNLVNVGPTWEKHAFLLSSLYRFVIHPDSDEGGTDSPGGFDCRAKSLHVLFGKARLCCMCACLKPDFHR